MTKNDSEYFEHFKHGALELVILLQKNKVSH